eukprot:m.247262 g.247262  ORF g.247262 m.247262 type:complete len:81 (-) comp19494_c0_seq2:269-511(-)
MISSHSGFTTSSLALLQLPKAILILEAAADIVERDPFTNTGAPAPQALSIGNTCTMKQNTRRCTILQLSCPQVRLDEWVI